MLVKQEQLNPCEVELEIEVEAEKVDSAVDETYAELGKVTNIPGFRKGKAPRAMLERYLDEEKVKDRVADKLLQPAYTEALEESKVEPFAPRGCGGRQVRVWGAAAVQGQGAACTEGGAWRLRGA